MLQAKIELIRRLLSQAQGQADAVGAGEEGQGGVYIGGGAIVIILIIILLILLL